MALSGFTAGDFIPSWTDPIGGFTLTGIAGVQPTYKLSNGLPFVSFDGTNDQLKSSSGPSSTTNATWYIVAAKRTLKWGSVNRGLASRQTFFQIVTLGFNSGVSHIYTLYDGTTLPTPISVTTALRMLEVVYNGSSSSMLVQDSVSTQTTTGDTGATAAGGYIIVGAETDGANFADADIGAVYYFNAILSSADRQSMRSYLVPRWGIAGTPTPSAATVGWARSSFSTLVNWYPLTSIVSSMDSRSINFQVVASERDPILAVSDFRAYKITDSQLTIP